MKIKYELRSVFDECTTYPVNWINAKRSMEMFLRWTRLSRKHFRFIR